MKMKLFNTATLALFIAAAPLAAHAGKIKTINAPLLITTSEVENASALAPLWEDGKRQELAGLTLIEDARKLDKSARKDLRKAEEKRVKAQAKADDRRATFVTISGQIGVAKTPVEAASAMKLASKSLDDWKDEVEQLAKAEARLRNAQSEIAAAASAVRNGEEQVIAGRAKMHRAEQQASGLDVTESHRVQAQVNDDVEFVDLR